jgi:hypothetical protein
MKYITEFIYNQSGEIALFMGLSLVSGIEYSILELSQLANNAILNTFTKVDYIEMSKQLSGSGLPFTFNFSLYTTVHVEHDTAVSKLIINRHVFESKLEIINGSESLAPLFFGCGLFVGACGAMFGHQIYSTPAIDILGNKLVQQIIKVAIDHSLNLYF